MRILMLKSRLRIEEDPFVFRIAASSEGISNLATLIIHSNEMKRVTHEMVELCTEYSERGETRYR